MTSKGNIFVVSIVLLAALGLIAAEPSAQPVGEGGRIETEPVVAAPEVAQQFAVAGSASRLIPYQGLLTNLSNDPVANGAYSLVFSLYDVAEGGGPLWTETHPAVAVTGGRFSIMLGSVTSLGVAFDTSLYLGIAVNGGAGMIPRKEFVPAMYAHEAGDAATLGGKLPGELMPVGSILPFAGPTPPDGWLLCDGAALASADYTALYNVIGHGWGGTDTNFRLPDLRGAFLRGVLGEGEDNRKCFFSSGGGVVPGSSCITTACPAGQDCRPYRAPDAADRVNGTGGNTGNAVGSYQGDTTKLRFLGTDTESNHNHGGTATTSGSKHQHDYPVSTAASGDCNWAECVSGGTIHWKQTLSNDPRSTHTHDFITSSDGSHNHSLTGGGRETRPFNKYVHLIIKYR